MKDLRRFSLSKIEKAFYSYLMETFIERTYWEEISSVNREHWKRFKRSLVRKSRKK